MVDMPLTVVVPGHAWFELGLKMVTKLRHCAAEKVVKRPRLLAAFDSQIDSRSQAFCNPKVALVFSLFSPPGPSRFSAVLPWLNCTPSSIRGIYCGLVILTPFSSITSASVLVLQLPLCSVSPYFGQCLHFLLVKVRRRVYPCGRLISIGGRSMAVAGVRA